nr:MAG TPA: hypothetical protein [Caudoviricetes sp.]
MLLYGDTKVKRFFNFFHAYLVKSKRPSFSLNLNHISGEAGNIPRQDFSPKFNEHRTSFPLRHRNRKNCIKRTPLRRRTLWLPVSVMPL